MFQPDHIHPGKCAVQRLRILLWIALLTAASTFAQSVPALVNYQGRLTDAAGAPLATGDYSLTFRIYGSASGNDLIWGPQVFDGTTGTGKGPKIPVVQGYFNVILGPVDTNTGVSGGRKILEAFTGSARFLEITVDTGAPVAPRQQILSAPYAFNAEKLGGSVTASGGILNAAGATITGNISAGGNVAAAGDATVIGKLSVTGTTGLGVTSPTAKLEVAGEVRTLDGNGNNRLWGQGRPGTQRYGSSGFESGLCTGMGVSFGLSQIISHWDGAAAACPRGTWVCTAAERGTNVCDTNRPDPGSDWFTCAGVGVDTPATSNLGWVADQGGEVQGKQVNEQGTGALTGVCNVLPVWCCSE
jgi:hypothetical protein